MSLSAKTAEKVGRQSDNLLGKMIWQKGNMPTKSKKYQEKTKQHTVYRTKDGVRVPGTTTISGILAKPALMKWANDLGLIGVEVGAYVDDLAQVGKLAHEMVFCHLTGKELDTSEYSRNDIDRAENSMISYLEWSKNKKIKVLLAETPIVSEEKLYGGTPDLYAEIDGIKTLVDFKTSKALYDDHIIQVVGGYKPLLEAFGHQVDKVTILRIGRTEDEGFETKTILKDQMPKYEQIFEHCRAIYNLRKEK